MNEHGEECSGLGILTMINDYNARLGWKFDQAENKNHEKFARVTTMVQLDV